MLPTHCLKLYAQTPHYMGMKIYNKVKGRESTAPTAMSLASVVMNSSSDGSGWANVTA